MIKTEFISILQKQLAAMNILDAEDIISEYDQHFNNKLADGYSEEEIAAKLGNPKELARQFNDANITVPTTGLTHTVITIGMIFVDIFVVSLFLLLFCSVIILGLFSISCAAVALCLTINLGDLSIIPSLPFGCGLIYSICLLSLAVLAALGTIYCFLYWQQLMRSYFRWHKNVFSFASGKPKLPPIPVQPQMKPKFRRNMRTVMLAFLTIFSATFILGYIACAIKANSLEFWHVWNWYK